jgi:hypothetical protein
VLTRGGFADVASRRNISVTRSDRRKTKAIAVHVSTASSAFVESA